MVEEAIEEGPAIRKPRATSHDVARLLLMLPLEPWRNSTPFFGAAAFCTVKIDDLNISEPSNDLFEDNYHKINRVSCWPVPRLPKAVISQLF